MLKILGRCCKIVICPLKTIFDVFSCLHVFCSSTGFSFPAQKEEVAYISQNSRVLYFLLGFFRVFLKYKRFKISLLYLQKIFPKIATWKSIFTCLYFISKQLFLSHGSVEADLVGLFLVLPSALLTAEQCCHQSQDWLC